MELPKPISFDWDLGNLTKNYSKHGVSPKESEEIFFNRIKIIPDKAHSKSEKRYYAFGITNKQRRLITIFTLRANRIRIISIRDQNKKERKFYEK